MRVEVRCDVRKGCESARGRSELGGLRAVLQWELGWSLVCRPCCVGPLLLLVGYEALMPCFVESEQTPAKIGQGGEESWVSQKLGPIGSGGGLSRGFEEFTSESYKLSTL